jgi:hypothetical protein
MESLVHQSFEDVLRKELGFLLIKPDSVQLGIAEELLQYSAQRIQAVGIGVLNGVYIIQIQESDIDEMYATVKEGVGGLLKKYLTEDISVLATFLGNSTDDVWEFLHHLRGKRLMDRTAEELDSSPVLQYGLIDIIPVPSTRKAYAKAMEKLKLRINDPSIPFDDDEYRVYCRNLVHVPDNLREVHALLNMLTPAQIMENLPVSVYKAIKAELEG